MKLENQTWEPPDEVIGRIKFEELRSEIEMVQAPHKLPLKT
jgi:hypothetical protein